MRYSIVRHYDKIEDDNDHLVGDGLAFSKMISGKNQGDNTSLIDAGIILLPQSRQLPDVTMTNQDGQPVVMNELKGKWSMLFLATPSARTFARPPSPNCARSKASCPKEYRTSCRSRAGQR